MIAIKTYYKRARTLTVRSSVADGLVAVLLLAIGIKFTAHLENISDVSLWDEANYMYNGLRIFDFGVPDPQYSPLYSFWYWCLSFFSKDAIDLYFLNYKVLTIVLPIAIFLVLRKYAISQIIAGSIAAYFLICMANLAEWPKPNHFLAICILALLFCTAHVEGRVRKMFILSTGALVCSYVRPELFISYIVFVLLLFVTAIQQVKILSRRTLTVLALWGLLLPTVLIGLFGSPLNGSRSQGAFCQHFALNWTHWTNSTIDPWIHCDQISELNFGRADTIPQMAMANFPAFARHLLTNITTIKTSLFNTFVLHVNFIIPSRSPYTDMLEGYIVFVAALLFISIYGYYHRYDILRNARTHTFLLLTCLIFALPFLVSVVLIYPRDHYTLTLGILALIIVAVMLFKKDGSTTPISVQSIAAFICVLFVITPSFAQSWRYEHHTPQNNTNLNTILFIKSLGIHQETTILESDGGYIYFLDRNFHWVPGYTKAVGFNQLMRTDAIDMIVVGPKLITDSRFTDDQEWQAFLNNYQAQGFKRVEIPNSGRILFLANHVSSTITP